MRGDKPSFVAATLVDKRGDIKYHLIPAGWVQIAVIAFAILLGIAMILGLLVLNNKLDIETIKSKIIVQEAPNANTSNTNR